jgi:hypothetical protein
MPDSVVIKRVFAGFFFRLSAKVCKEAIFVSLGVTFGLANAYKHLQIAKNKIKYLSRIFVLFLYLTLLTINYPVSFQR